MPSYSECGILPKLTLTLTWIAVIGFADGLCATYLGEVSDKEKAKRRVEANICRRLVVLFSVFISFSLLPRSYPLLPYR
jgi:hypothetical protein